MEMYNRNTSLEVAISTMETVDGLRENSRGAIPNAEYAEFLFKKLANLDKSEDWNEIRW